jgi:hypothetical protein
MCGAPGTGLSSLESGSERAKGHAGSTQSTQLNGRCAIRHDRMALFKANSNTTERKNRGKAFQNHRSILFFWQ